MQVQIIIVSLHRFKSMGSYQSGQMGLTVTQLAYAFGGSNPSLPTKTKNYELKTKDEKLYFNESF